MQAIGMALKDSLCVFVILTAWGQVTQVIIVMIAIIAIIVIVVIIEEVVILVMTLHLFNALCKQISHWTDYKPDGFRGYIGVRLG